MNIIKIKKKAVQNAIKMTQTEANRSEGTYAVTVDLQQAVPTNTEPTYYNKKLFCFKLSIHSFHQLRQ